MSLEGPGQSGAFVVWQGCEWRKMRKPGAASVAAQKASLPSGVRGGTPTELVCAALALALLVLAARIASIW